MYIKDEFGDVYIKQQTAFLTAISNEEATQIEHLNEKKGGGGGKKTIFFYNFTWMESLK